MRRKSSIMPDLILSLSKDEAKIYPLLSGLRGNLQ